MMLVIHLPLENISKGPKLNKPFTKLSKHFNNLENLAITLVVKEFGEGNMPCDFFYPAQNILGCFTVKLLVSFAET